jgi:hypothetical protein
MLCFCPVRGGASGRLGANRIIHDGNHSRFRGRIGGVNFINGRIRVGGSTVVLFAKIWPSRMPATIDNEPKS